MNQISHPYFTAKVEDGDVMVEFDNPEEFDHLVYRKTSNCVMSVYTTWGEELYILTYDGETLELYEKDDWQVYLESIDDTEPVKETEI